MYEFLGPGFAIWHELQAVAQGPLRRRRLHRQLHRMLYLEAVANLEVLTALKRSEGFERLAVDSPAFAWAVRQLSTKALETVLLGDWEHFGAVGPLAEQVAEENDDDSAGDLRTPYLVMRYLAMKIAFLRSVLDGGVGLPVANMNVPLRIKRIHAHYVQLVQSLAQMPEVAPFVVKR